MFTANTDLEIVLRVSAAVGGGLYELSYPRHVELLERFVRQDSGFDVVGKESGGIVTAESERQLCEIVRAEREEIGFLGY